MCRSKIIWQRRAGVDKWTADENKLPPVQIENLKWRAQSRTIREEMISCISYYEQCWSYFGETFSISAATSPQIHTSRQFVACLWVGGLLVLLIGADVAVRRPESQPSAEGVAMEAQQGRETVTEAGPKPWLGGVHQLHSCSGLRDGELSGQWGWPDCAGLHG